MMQPDVMLHLRQPLDQEERESLLAHLAERMGLRGTVHDSAKPNLVFVLADAEVCITQNRCGFEIIYPNPAQPEPK